jgi:hypothetical protein
MLGKLYDKFDKMQEPYRFLTFFGIFAPIIIFIQMARFEYALFGWLVLGFLGITKATNNNKN